MAATWPPGIIVELFYDGVWNNITPDVRLTADIEMELGKRNEGADAADPGNMTLLLNNGRSHVNPAVSGRYSTKNPRSDLFGKIGKNSRIRVRVDEEPPVPVPFLADTFERTVSPGWGTADTGQTWFIQENIDNGTNDTDYSVSDGLGNTLMDSVNPSSFRMIQADLTDKKTDLDVVVTMQTDQRSIDTSGLSANFGGVAARVSDDGLRFIVGALWFAADGGLPDGQGLRVATSIVSVVDGSNAEEVQGNVIPNLVYEVGVPLNVRFRVEGPEVRMRVWAEDETEPTLWHSQAHIELVTDPGDFAIFSQGSADGTTLPVTVSYDSLSVSDPPELDEAVRGVFEVYEWPPRWDISDSDQWVPIVTNGILRRLNQGTQPIRSALRRYIASVFPVAYWPLEDTGFLGRFGVEAIAGGQSLALAGIKFAEDDDVPGSEPLPELQASSGFISPGIGTSPFMRSGDVPAVNTGSWSVQMLVRFPEDDFPDTDQHIFLRFFTSGTAGLWILRAFRDAGSPALRLRVVDQDSVLIGDETATESAALAANGPALTDEWRVITIRVNDDGAGNVDWRFDWFTLDGAQNWGNGSSYVGDAGRFRRIDTTFSPDLAGMRFGHLTAWGVRDPIGYFDRLTLLHPTLGFEGEEARERVRRIASEESTNALILGNADTRMGPQTVSAFNELIEEAAVADIAILTEQRNESGLLLRARELMYNQDPVLIFDYANGEMFSPFEPTDDDQRINNAVTATREGGASATAVQEVGQLNVNSPIRDPDGVGEYPASFTVNVESDDQLPSYAGWRLHLGTVDELRYPRITINLANERIRPLIEEIIAIREGTKIMITNPPDWLPADDIELIVEGYKETLNAFRWEITLVCSPASPWTVGNAAENDVLLSEDFEDADLSIDTTDGGDAAWFRTQDDVIFGEWSMRAGIITDNQTSDLIIQVPDQAVAFQLWYKVSSEATFDFFRILVDGVEVFSDSGIGFWRQIDPIDVDGATTVTLRYEKDAAVSSGDDTVYVDEVTFLALASGTELPDRADTTKSVLTVDIDNDDTTLRVRTNQPADPFVRSRSEWVGAAIPLNPNGDFEVDLSGWSGQGATLARVETPSDTQQFGGAWSMQIMPDGVTEFPNAGSDLFPVTEGRDYEASAWLRNDTTRLMSLSLNWFDAGFNFLDNDFRDQTVQSDVWTFFEVQGTAPAGAAFANIAPTVPDFPATTDVGYADEVFLRSVEPWSMPAEVPFNARLSPSGGSSGEVVRVRAIEPLEWDNFTRTEVDQWGEADSGFTWLPAGGVASDRSVDGTQGVITLQANPEQIRFQQVPGESVSDSDIVVDLSVDQVATGASMIPGVLLRAAGDYYRARLHFSTGGSMFMSVTRVVTVIGSTPSLIWTYDPDEVFRLRVRIVGQRILARAWPIATVLEPQVWHIDRTVTDDPIAEGLVGVTGSAFAGNTNVNPAIMYDNFQIVTPQRIVVDRGVNEITREHPAGTDFRLAQPAIVAL